MFDNFVLSLCNMCTTYLATSSSSWSFFLHFNSQAKGSERSNMIFVAWTLCSWWLCYTIAPIQYQLLRFNINCSNSIWNEISIETSPAPSHPSSGRPTEIRNKSESPIRDHSADRDQNPQIDWSQDFKACLFHKSSKPSDYATIGNSGWEKKENAYLCIPCPRCINWAEPSSNFSNKISSVNTHLVHLVI